MPSSFESLDFSFEEFSKPTKFDTKTQSINQKLAQKSKDLGTISGSNFYDADTAYLDGKRIRTGETSGLYPDAPERKINGVPVTGQADADYQASRIAVDNFGSNVVANPEASAELRRNPLTPENQKLYDKSIRNERKNQRMNITGIEGHVDRYGRQIGSMFNESGESLQDRLIETGNATLKTGVSAAVEDTGDFKIGSSSDGSKFKESRAAEFIDIAQSGGVQEFGKTYRLLDSAIKGLGLKNASKNIDEFFGVDEAEEDLMKFALNVADQDNGQKVADAYTGVSDESRKEQQVAMQESEKQWEEGDYLGSIATAATQVDRLIADSAAVTGEIMVPFVGAATYAANKTQDQSIKYKENNDKEMSEEDMAKNFGINLALILPEKLLIKMGVRNMMPGSKSRIRNVAVGTGGEALQEYAEGIQDTLSTQKEGERTLGEIASDPKQIHQGAVGGLVGGTLSTGANVVGGASTALKEKTTEQLAKKVSKVAKAESEKKEPEPTVTPDEEVPVTRTEDELVKEEDKIFEVLDDEKATPEQKKKAGEELEVLQKEMKQNIENTMAKELVSRGVEPTEAKRVAKEKVTKQFTPGISSAVSLAQRISDVNIEPVGSVDTIAKTSKKERTFDAGEVTEETINTAVDGGLTKSDVTSIANQQTSKLTERLVKRLELGSETNKVLRKTRKSIEKSLSDKDTKAKLDTLVGEEGDSTAKAMRVMSLVMAGVSSSVDAEADIRADKGLAPKSGTTRSLGLNVQLGKDYMNSFGTALRGSEEATSVAYANIGNQMLDIAEKMNLVEREEALVPVQALVTKSGKSTFSTKDISKLGSEKSRLLATEERGTKGQSVTSIKDNTIILSKDNAGIAREMSVLARLLKPTNVELPTEVPVDEVPVDRSLSDNHLDIIKNINKLRFFVKPEFIGLLKDVKTRVGSRDIDEAFAKDKEILKLIGVESNNPVLRKKNEQGRNRGRKDILRELVDNIEEIEAMNEEGFHYNYESAINQRIHLMQTILEFQGDKRMARQMVSQGEYTTNAQGADVLVKTLAEELGISEQDVLEPKGKMKALLDRYSEKYTVRSSNLISKAMGQENPFRAMSLYKAMHDVYVAKNKDKITTDYAVEYDATASGVVNTLMNLSGNPEVQEVLKKMGVNNEENLDGVDPYNHHNNTISELEPEVAREVMPVIDELVDKMGFKLRDLAKGPVMTWFYGQMEENTSNIMAENIAIDLVMKANNYNNNALKKINKISGTNYTIDNMEGEFKPLIRDIKKSDLDKVAEHYMPMAEVYIENLNKSFPAVSDYRKTMGSIYNILENTNEWNGEIGTAMSALELKDIREGKSKANAADVKSKKASLKKLKTTVSDISVDGNPVLVNKKFNNRTSFFVNLQHLSDAAQLLRSMEDYMVGQPELGVMTVHDAEYGSANEMDTLKDSYEKNIVDTAVEYDYIGTAIDEASSAISKMPDGKDKDVLTKKLNEIKKLQEPVLKSKKEFLKDTKTDIFGLKNQGRRSAEQPKAVKEKKTSNKKIDKQKSFAKDAMTWQNSSASYKQKLQELLANLDVSSTHKSLLEKTQKMLNGDMEVIKSTSYSGAYNKIYVDKKLKDPRTGEVLTPDTFVEVLAHEIDHATSFNYIENNMNAGEIKHIVKLVDRLKTLGSMPEKAKNRVGYILSPISKADIKNESERRGISEEDVIKIYQVSEFVSVMRNEPEIAKEIEGFAKTPTNLFQKLVQVVVDKARKLLSKMSSKQRSDYFNDTTEPTMKNTIRALETTIMNAEEFGSIAKDNEAVAPSMARNEDIYKDAYKNPYKYAQNIIEKQNSYIATFIGVWGGAAIDILSPIAKKGNQYGIANSSAYRGAVGLIRTGFYDSKIAQEMKSVLGVSKDVDSKLMNKLLNLGTSIAQESATILTDNLRDLDDRINTKYKDKKDRVRVFEIFNKTGIGGLEKHQDIVDGLKSGTMSIDDAIGSLDIRPENVERLEQVANYYSKGVMTNGYINLSKAGLYGEKHKAAVALYAMKNINGSEKMIKDMDEKLFKELYSLSITNRYLAEEVNELAIGFSGKYTEGDPRYDIDYDGHFSMDVYENQYEFRTVDKRDLKSNEFTKENEWIVVKEPDGIVQGIVARPMISAGNTPGVGLNINKFKNGFYLDQEHGLLLRKKLEAMTDRQKNNFLDLNQIVDDNGRYRYVIDYATAVDKLEIKQSVAHGLLRTYVHNKELIEMGSVRQIVQKEATERIYNRDDLDKLAKKIRANRNDNADNVLPMFVDIRFDYESHEKLPKEVKMFYMSPKNLTTYNDFNRSVSLVKKSESSALIGHRNFSLFGDRNRDLAKVESAWKKLVVFAKQHMVVTSASKLAVDFVSNIGILETRGMGTIEIAKGFKKGWREYNKFAEARGDIVNAKIAVMSTQLGSEERAEAKAKLDKLEENLKIMPFYDAFNYGFVQSYSTNLVTKDFDSVSGLQKDIDNIVEYVTTDKRGNYNEIQKAIKWWQSFGASKGFSVDSLITTASKLSSANKTSIGSEIENLVDRLRKTKDTDSVARYIGNILGTPASEVTKIGGSFMVTTDALSKYTLARGLLIRTNEKTGKKYTKEEAYLEANEVFIDYRRNMPEQVKILSDYGILMFPSFWLRIQKVIYNLLRYNPTTAVAGYAIADLLNANQANIIDSNIINKIDDGRIINDPTTLLDWRNLVFFL